MNSREELFKKFFNDGKAKVKDLDDDALRAHIEELQEIAFQAKAFLHAADETARERNASKRRGSGINTSVAMDEVTSDAINTISIRQEKMSKTEKAIQNLVNAGFDRADAEKMYSPAVINAVKKQKPGDKKLSLDEVTKKFPKTEIQFSNSIRGKCPNCLTLFPDTTNSGAAVCEKCGTDVMFEKVVKVSNPFDKPKILEPNPIEEHDRHHNAMENIAEAVSFDTKTGPVEILVTNIAQDTIEVHKIGEETKSKFVNPFEKKG